MRLYLSRPAHFVTSAELLWLLLLAPVLLFPSPARSPAMLVLPGTWLWIWLANRHFIPRTPLDGALLLLVTMVLVSLYATFDIAFSLPKISGVLLGIATYYAIVRRIYDPPQLWLATYLAILLGGGLAVLGLLGTDWPYKIPVLQAITGRLPVVIRGLPGAAEGFHPNEVAGSLIFFVPLQLTLLAASYESVRHQNGRVPLFKYERIALGVQVLLFVVTGGAVLLTQSRSAWLGLVVGTAAWLIWHGPRSRRLLLAALAISAVLVLLISPARFLGLVTRADGTSLAEDAATREEIWSRALYALQDFPFTGVGMNAFRRVMPVLYPAFLIPPDFDVAHAHNHLLQAGLDLGLPGLIAYLAVWLGAAHMLISTSRLTRDAWLRSLVEGLGAGLLAHFTFGIGDAIALGAKPGIVLWIMLALVASLYRTVHNQLSDIQLGHSGQSSPGRVGLGPPPA